MDSNISVLLFALELSVHHMTYLLVTFIGPLDLGDNILNFPARAHYVIAIYRLFLRLCCTIPKYGMRLINYQENIT